MGECPRCGDIGIEGTTCLDCGCADYEKVTLGVDWATDRKESHEEDPEAEDARAAQKAEAESHNRPSKATDSDKDDYPF